MAETSGLPAPLPEEAARPRGRGIRLRVGLLAAAGASLPLAILAATAWSILRDDAARLQDARRALAASVAARLDDRLQQDLGLLSTLSSAARLDAAGGDCAQERAAFHAARLRSRHLARILLAGADGTVRCEEPWPAEPGTIVIAIPEVAEALQSGRPTVTGLVGGRPGYALMLAPFLGPGSTIAGVVAGVIDPASPAGASSLGAAAVIPGASTEVVDSAGAVLARTGPHGMNRASAVAAALDAAPWRVVLRHDADGVAAYGLRSRLIVVGGVSVSIALLFAWGVARSVTRPLAALGRSAARIAAGDLSEPVPARPGDEVGSLGRSLEAMRVALQDSVAALHRERDELERRVAERTRELEVLYATLRDREERRAQLLRKTISAQEDERKRIARELHDQTCQALAALILSLHAASTADAPEPVRQRLADARGLAGSTLEEVHRVILDLRPSVLDDLGLVPALRWFAARHLDPLGVAVRWEVEGPEGRLAPDVETALFRAAQEALTNVARHAHAETVLVQIVRSESELHLEIEDDGDGFDPASLAGPVRSARGLGLTGIRERLELLGGSAEIESSPGQGTRVVLRAPLGGAGDA